MSFIAPDHPQYNAIMGDAIDRYVEGDDFNGHECACGQRMHANDVECRDCWREREYPES